MTRKRRLPSGVMTKKAFDSCIIAAEKSREDRAEEAYERGDWTEAQKIMRGDANASTDDNE